MHGRGDKSEGCTANAGAATSCNGPLAQLHLRQVISFDDGGVSGHRNHVATAQGVLAFARSPRGASVAVFALESVSLLRKFSGPLDVLASAVAVATRAAWAAVMAAAGESTAIPECVFVANPDPGAAQRALHAHASQAVWFRRLFVVFSRYAYVNTLNRVR